jgi:hypothetical protein
MSARQWSDQEKDILSYALKYFEIHAAQRMSVFNFFIVLSTILLTGLATCVFGEAIYAPIGIALGLMLTALSLTFWKLDQRTSFLIKRAEKTLSRLEGDHFPAYGKIISEEAAEFKKLNDNLAIYRKRWTYSVSLGLVFAVVGTMGIAGTTLAATKSSGLVHWFDKASPEAKPSISVETIQHQAPPMAAPIVPNAEKEKTPGGGPAQASH